MKALTMRSNRPRDLAVIEAPVPEPSPCEVRLRVRAVGVCGSDVSASLAKPNFDWVQRPMILGHEFSGEIDKIGAEVEGWEKGQRACALSVQGCGSCVTCLEGNTQQCRERTILGLTTAGAMAEYCTVSAEHLVSLSDGLSDLEGALTEPLAVAVRCVHRACGVKHGDEVVVSGCGIIGLLCALVARTSGARVVVTGTAQDQEVRLQTARELGFSTIVVGDQSPLADQLGEPVDIFIEASGAPSALTLAPAALKCGGLMGVVATYPQLVEIPVTDMVRSEQRLHSCFGSTRGDYVRAIDHIAAGQVPVGQLVETFPLSEAVAAFDASIEKRTPKAVILP